MESESENAVISNQTEAEEWSGFHNNITSAIALHSGKNLSVSEHQKGCHLRNLHLTLKDTI